MRIEPLVSAGIILSYKCNSRCRHCLYSCSSKWREWADISLVESIFAGTKKCTREVYGFHIAGGEAFLDFQLLLDSMRLATKYQIPIDYIETNGGWFVDEKSAIDKMEELKEAGLTCLLVSASPFHAEHIPLEKTLGTIRASQKVFGTYGTMVWLPEFLQQLTNIRETGTVSFEEYIKSTGERGAKSAATYLGQLIPGGRSSYHLSDYLPQSPIESFFGENCHYELIESRRGHFDNYGNIITGVCSGISVGDAHDLENAYTNFDPDANPVIKLLITEGVGGLYKMASKKYGYKPQMYYSGKCHLCMDIRKHLVASGADFSELTPKQFYEEI